MDMVESPAMKILIFFFSGRVKDKMDIIMKPKISFMKMVISNESLACIAVLCVPCDPKA